MKNRRKIGDGLIKVGKLGGGVVGKRRRLRAFTQIFSNQLQGNRPNLLSSLVIKIRNNLQTLTIHDKIFHFRRPHEPFFRRRFPSFPGKFLVKLHTLTKTRPLHATFALFSAIFCNFFREFQFFSFAQSFHSR